MDKDNRQSVSSFVVLSINEFKPSLTKFGAWRRSFLLVNDGVDNRILVFATLYSLQLFGDSPKVFMDGTFYTSPPLFHQMYTIHGYFKGQVMPFVYALLPNKNYETYNRLLTLIKEKVNTYLALSMA